MNLTVNSEFGGRYKLIKQLGVGGFAQVWLGEDLMAGDIQIALKIFVSENGLDEASIKVFRDEFKVVFHLNHPHLLKPMHFDISNNTPYLVLPYCEKGSLLSMSGHFDEAEIAKLMYQIGGALAHMHQQETPILHQDIKPENILIDSNDNYYLSDFGISSKLRRTLTKSMSARSNSSGTTAFMAPERFMAKRSIQPASDVFSFGCMMYELITDELPFGQLGGILLNNGAEIPSMEGQCSMMLADIIKRCLSLNPEERPKATELENYGKHYLANFTWFSKNQPRGAIKTAINHQEKASPAPQALPLDNQKTMPINSNWEFHDGLARVMKDGKYGFVNQNGIEVIAPQYDEVDHFYEQRARVRKGYYWGFIDTLGRIIVEIKYKEAGNFSQGLAWLKDGKLYGYVDLNGYVVIPFEFSKASSFNNDYAIVNSALDPINYLRVLSKNNLVSPPFGGIKRWNDDSDIFLVMDNKKIRYGIFQISKGLIIPTEYDLKYKSDKHITLVKNKKAIDVIMQPDGQIEIKENLRVSQELYAESKKMKKLVSIVISIVLILIIAIILSILISNAGNNKTSNEKESITIQKDNESTTKTNNNKNNNTTTKTSNAKQKSTNVEQGTAQNPMSPAATSSNNLKIGDTYAGGLIFYIDGTGKHGLVCAPYDQSSGAAWGCYNTFIGGTSTYEGSGLSNTQKIVNSCSESNSAARICSNLVLNGYSDWFLPSKNELSLMYINLQKKGLGNFARSDYWSSTEGGNNGAWAQTFGRGYICVSIKNGTYYVRAVRAF